jgi:hypothetical protein
LINWDDDPQGSKMPSLSKKRSGRPKGTTKVTFEHLQDIWLRVEVLRAQTDSKTRRRHSVSRACEILEERGGLIWIVGGDVETIAREIAKNEKPPIKNWRRVALTRKGKGFRAAKAKAGRVIVSHQMQSSGSIRLRYTQANAMFKNNPHIHEAWTNYLCDMLGRPRPSRERINLWRPPFVRTAVEPN